jgi:NitT/TauT family transport system permease protein
MSTAADTSFTGVTPASARMTTMGRVGRHIALFLIIMVIWELLSAYNIVDQLILPRPSEIAMSLFNMVFFQGNVWWHFLVTLWESLAGFVIGSAIGIALAIAAALNESFRRYISPYIVAIQVTPRIALAPW